MSRTIQRRLRKAEKLIRALIAKTRVLGEFPQMGRIVPELKEMSSLREVIYHPYRVIYRVNNRERAIEVIRFWHAARGTPRF